LYGINFIHHTNIFQMLLSNKNAVIYGGGGSLGSTIARAFAKEGATIFLAGRTKSSLEKVAKEIITAGGKAEIAVVDAMNEKAVNDHMASVDGRHCKHRCLSCIGSCICDNRYCYQCYLWY
jgi:NADP-dependent 3-hydroxy acid dehydrogenase YdfG